MKKIELAFFIHTLGRGGAEQALVNLVNGLNQKKFNVTVYTVLNTGELKNEINKEIDVISLFKLPKFFLKKQTTDTGTLKKGKNKLSLISKLYGFLWRNTSHIIAMLSERKLKKHDIFISYLEGPTSKLVSNLKTNTIKIAWVHVDLSKEKKSELFFHNMDDNLNHYSQFDKIIAVSADVKKSLVDYIGVETQVDVLYNVYRDNKIIEMSAERLTPKEKLLFKSDRINFISVGRLTKQKGYDRLIKAIKIIKNTHKNVYDALNFIILGDGELKEDLINQINVNNLEKKVSLYGFCSNPYKMIRNSDVFICSSRTEGFSTVVVESVILDVPVITTDCSGMLEILDNNPNSIIRDNSTEGIVNLILDFFNKHEEEKNNKKIEESRGYAFSFKKAISDHESYFDKLAGELHEE